MLQVFVRNKPFKTPNNIILEVPTNELVKAILSEVDFEPIKAMHSHDTVFTSLAFTAIDKAPIQRNVIIDRLIHICGNDQILCWSSQYKNLIEEQKRYWSPLIDIFNYNFSFNLKKCFYLNRLSIHRCNKLSLREWCLSLNNFQLVSFSYMVMLSGSFIVSFCIVKGIIATAEDGWSICSLQEKYQRLITGENLEEKKCIQYIERDFIKSYKFFIFSL